MTGIEDASSRKTYARRKVWSKKQKNTDLIINENRKLCFDSSTKTRNCWQSDRATAVRDTFLFHFFFNSKSSYEITMFHSK